MNAVLVTASCLFARGQSREAAFSRANLSNSKANGNGNGVAEPNLPAATLAMAKPSTPPTAMAKPSRTSHHQLHDGEAEPPTTAMAKPSRTGQYVIGQPVMTQAEQQTQPRTNAIGA